MHTALLLFVCKNVLLIFAITIKPPISAGLVNKCPDTQRSLIAFSECCVFISVSMLKLKSPTAATAIAEMTTRIRNEKSFHQIKYSLCCAWKYKTYPDLGLAISFVTAVAPGARLPNGSHVAALLFCSGARARIFFPHLLFVIVIALPGPRGDSDTSNQELILELQTKVPEDYALFYNHD